MNKLNVRVNLKDKMVEIFVNTSKLKVRSVNTANNVSYEMKE